MKAVAVVSMRPKAAGSGERISVGVRSGSVVRLDSKSVETSKICGSSLLPAGERWNGRCPRLVMDEILLHSRAHIGYSVESSE